MSRACATHSDFDFFSDDSSNSDDDEKVKCKLDDFSGLCLIGKFPRNFSDSDSDISDDLSPDSLSLRVVELENAWCNQDKLFCKVFYENKKLNLELKSSISEIASLCSVHDDMSVKPYDNYRMIMINYVDLWLVHAKVAHANSCDFSLAHSSCLHEREGLSLPCGSLTCCWLSRYRSRSKARSFFQRCP
jgi:hypothetical protein